MKYKGQGLIILGLVLLLNGVFLFAQEEDSLAVLEEEVEDVLESIAGSEEKISLDLKGIDINELFRMLSLKMGIAIVPTKNVSGRINVFLNNLTLEDALDVILASQDLAAERDKDIISIMTSNEYERLYGRKYNERRKLSSLKLSYARPSTVFSALAQIKSDIGKVIVDETTATIFMLDTPERLELMERTARELDLPLETEVFDLEYADADNIKTHLSSLITPGSGEMLVDNRSTKVVVSDLPERIKKIRRIIKAFDTEDQQVLINTSIVEITLKENEYQRQIDWQRVFTDLHRKISTLDIQGTFPVASSFTPSPALSADNMQITIGTVASDDYTATLNYLDTLGDTKVISQPKIMVMNNQDAKIMVGSKEAYVIQSLSQGSGTTVSAEDVRFIDVGVILNVSPTIHNDGFITMKIKPEVSTVREVITTELGSRIPIVDTSEMETVVKLKDGAMIMLAGMFKQDNRADNSGTPILSRIPFLGGFFGARADLDKRTEVVVFISPKLVRGDEALAGTKPEEILPADAVAKDEILEGDVVSRAVTEEIKNVRADLIQEVPSEFEELAIEVIQLPGKGMAEMQGKFKGFKTY